MQTQTTSVPIQRDMMIGDVVAKYPAVADVFLSYGLHCVGCHVNAYETIEQGSMGHGMTDEEVDEMVAEANDYLERLHANKDTFTITKKAVDKLLALSAEEEKKMIGLRVAVHAGGCSGYKYALDFTDEKAADDTVYDEGYPVFVDPASKEHLKGATLDYIDGLNGSGFKIDNPNAKSHCGCGKSFN